MAFPTNKDRKDRSFEEELALSLSTRGEELFGAFIVGMFLGVVGALGAMALEEETVSKEDCEAFVESAYMDTWEMCEEREDEMREKEGLV